MMWPFPRHGDVQTRRQEDERLAHSEDAMRAIEQAQKADDDADRELAEMRKVISLIRAQRQKNHFSAAIWESMRRK